MIKRYMLHGIHSYITVYIHLHVTLTGLMIVIYTIHIQHPNSFTHIHVLDVTRVRCGFVRLTQLRNTCIPKPNLTELQLHDSIAICMTLWRHSSRSKRLHAFRREALTRLDIVVAATTIYLALRTSGVMLITIDAQMHQLGIRKTVKSAR